MSYAQLIEQMELAMLQQEKIANKRKKDKKSKVRKKVHTLSNLIIGNAKTAQFYRQQQLLATKRYSQSGKSI